MVRFPKTMSSVVLVTGTLVLTAAVATTLVGLPAAPVASPAATVTEQAAAAINVAPRAARTRPVVPARPPQVSRLGGLHDPDLLIEADRTLTPSQITALRRVKGIVGFTVLDVGPVKIGAKTYQAAAVDPSTFRAFTPRQTAASDPLWAAVARGELASSYSSKLPLGRTLPLAGRTVVKTRVGALASFGLPGTDVVIDRAGGKQLGLARTVILLTAPERKITRLKANVVEAIGTPVELSVLRPEKLRSQRPSTYRELYIASAPYCPGLSWKVLAAIGQIESAHGVNVHASSAGALGPMQFMPATWAWAGVDGDGDGKADVMNAFDAVPAAALYLCRHGAGRGGQALYDSIFSYNHADWYVKDVLQLAARYR